MFKYDCALVIDEDPISNFVTAKTLDKLNIAKEIKTSINISHTIDQIKELNEKNESCPELILLDLYMKEEHLVDFWANFSSMKFGNKEKIRVILLTIDSSIGVSQAKRIGLPFIQKPVSEENLRALL